MDKILNRIFRKYNKHGFNIQYRHFTELWIRKMLGNKTFKVDSPHICTTDNVISVGEEYQYKEGGFLERVIIEDISFRRLFMILEVYFIDQDRWVICEHKMAQYGHMGMWRIWDKGRYDLEEWRRERNKPVDQSLLDSIPVIYI
jgi:hypothetical protein